MTDPKDLKLPTTTREFSQWLRDIAEQVDRIPDRPLQLDESAVEPTGLHFAVDFASTEYSKPPPRRAR